MKRIAISILVCLVLTSCGERPLCLTANERGTVVKTSHEEIRPARGRDYTRTYIKLTLPNGNTKVCFTTQDEAALLEPGDRLAGPF